VRARIERQKLENVDVIFTNARNLGFPAGSFDIAVSGFMGWYDCFDFLRNEFTQPDKKGTEIHRVLRDGGRIVCCSWEAQEDLAWMEGSMLRHYPELLEDGEYLERRPIGMAYEKPAGYEMIFQTTGFHDIEITKESADFISTDEEEWWQQMLAIGWDTLIEKIEQKSPDRLQRLKEAIFRDIQPFKHSDGIHFTKRVFFVGGVKRS
jgi:ubiquinone/menaquinone biosynthesis C-methylase UbiE